MENLNIIGDSGKRRKSMYDPNLAERVNKETEAEIRKERLEAKLNKKKDGTSLKIKADINRKDYIQIPDTSLIISKREMHYNKNWEDAHLALAGEGLFMPSPAIFIDYFLRVKEAGEGSLILKDAEGNSLSREESNDLWDYISSTDRTKFSGKICWTWLDAKFVKNPAGKLELETQHKLVSGKLGGRTFPLDSYVQEDCYVDLEFNSQGLAVRKAKTQSYQQGENIYFYAPRENTVAGFDADSGGVGLDCDWGPSVRDASLGVFGCAEGASQNFSPQPKTPHTIFP